jgi:type I restriction enzyme S subunit
MISQKYKNTEVGIIPEDWEVQELREVAEFASGTTPRREQHERYFQNGNINWVKTLDLNNAEITDTQEKITEIALKETSSLKIFPKETVLVAMYGGYNQIGRTGLLKINACVNQALTAIKTNRNILYPFFLINYLNYRVDYWKDVATSSRKDPNITSKDVKDFKIPIPALSEQTAIATALSNADALISGLEKLIAKKRNIKQGAMQKLLQPKEGWEVKKLGDISEIYTGKKNNQDKIENGVYPFFVRSQTIERINTYSFDGEAILIPGEGNIGRIFHYINGKFDFHQRVYKISDFKSGYFSKYIYRYISEYFGRHAMENSVKATVDSLRLPTFQVFEIPFPPTYQEQENIATILSDMDNEITALEIKLEKYKKVKLGMMQNLLTGKIRLV